MKRLHENDICIIPESLLIETLAFLSVLEVISFSSCCSRFHKFTCSHPMIWKTALEKYPIALNHKSTVIPCMNSAIHLLRIRRVIKISSVIPWLYQCFSLYDHASGILLALVGRNRSTCVAEESIRYRAILISIPEKSNILSCLGFTMTFCLKVA